jgi:hypothetical protein
LFLRKPCSCRAVNLSSDFAAAYERGLSVTSTSGAKPCFLSSFAHQFTAAVFASPSQLQIENLAFIVDRSPEPKSPAGDQNGHLVKMSVQVGRCRLRRSSLANNGPNFNTHRLTVS